MEAEAWAGDHEVNSAQGFPFVPFLFCIPVSSLTAMTGLLRLLPIQMACQAPFPISSTLPSDWQPLVPSKEQGVWLRE